MLVVTRQQQRHLAEATFRRSVADAISAALAGVGLPSGCSAEAMAGHGIAVARTYGFTSQRDIVFFVLNMASFHPQYHEEPEIHHVLVDKRLELHQRLAALLDAVPAEVWERVRARPDASACWRAALQQTAPEAE